MTYDLTNNIHTQTRTVKLATMTTDELISSDPAQVRAWLGRHHSRQLAELEAFEIELRLGRLSTSSTAAARYANLGQKDADINQAPGAVARKDRRLVTTRTVELFRSIIGSTKWKVNCFHIL